MGLPLTAVTALTHGLAIPDVALGTLLGAHKLVASGTLWHAHGTLASFDVHVARRHATFVTTHVGAALFEGLTVLR